jgi:hypothetical protein
MSDIDARLRAGVNGQSTASSTLDTRLTVNASAILSQSISVRVRAHELVCTSAVGAGSLALFVGFGVGNARVHCVAADTCGR